MGTKSSQKSRFITKKKLIFIISLEIIALFLYAAKIHLNNTLSTKGIDLARVEEEISRVKQENLILQEQLYTAKSLVVIEEKAKKAGFIRIQSFYIIY